jgi:hypothetical protein
MVSVSDINPLKNVNLGMSIGTVGSIILILTIAILILILVGVLIYWRIVKKSYWINIEVSRLIGGIPQRVATYSAKEVPFGMAGDKLWKVAPAGFIKLKTIKWLPVGKLQSSPRTFKYWIREDGEWINYIDTNIDETSKIMGVRFVQEDMILQRLATERLLEQRLMNKSFWEKWGTTVMMILVFLVVAVCMVIIFYQFSTLMDKFSDVQGIQLETSKILFKTFGEQYVNDAKNMSGGDVSGLIPA